MIAQTSSESEDPTKLDFSKELTKMAKVPNSPEAAAFAKYGDQESNLYTGTPNIKIPIYSIQGSELSIPISLTYDASGVKVNQMASQVGLGWNLNLGGRISRQANGLPDDYIEGGYATMNDPIERQRVQDFINDSINASFEFQNFQAAMDYLGYLKLVNKNLIDTQPDLFSLNVLDLNDMLVFDYSMNSPKPKALNNSRLKIFALRSDYTTHNISEWTITGEDGTKYYFEVAEQTKRIADDNDDFVATNLVNTYNSSWLLTKIVSANGFDEFVFNYETNGFWYQDQYMNVSESASHSVDYTNGGFVNDGTYSKSESEINIKQQFVKSVFHNGKKIIEIDFINRYDLELSCMSSNKTELFQ
ncbi:MAG: hypothetical protein OIF50_14575 [Flavobacteriaceae bacterium]|nr:hypothetical protein [Flavobacteriaceae bacterium]